MPLHGEFIVNDAQFSLYSYTVLALFWLTRAMEYIVTAGCVAIPDNGPIPQGRYHIVNRLTGGWK